LATDAGGSAFPYHHLEAAWVRVDGVICTTAAPHVVF
jgi:hypothetical protein